MNEIALNALRSTFGRNLQENVHMKNYTTIRAGGPADALLIAHDAGELEKYIQKVWELDLPLLVIGSGSNILISDKGVRGVVIINHAHNIRVQMNAEPYTIKAESGALIGKVARLAANRSLTGLEWAASLPGTVGGAVFGNAGCFGKETADDFIQAEILHRNKGIMSYSQCEMGFEYRASVFKRESLDAVVLSATYSVAPGVREEIFEKMDTYKKRRLRNQPPGPSMGSVFRNPTDDKAGRMIEQTGLKGHTIGGAEISAQHANFIINANHGNAMDVWNLINMIENAVYKKFGRYLHPEIQLTGDWDEDILMEFEKYQTSQES